MSQPVNRGTHTAGASPNSWAFRVEHVMHGRRAMTKELGLGLALVVAGCGGVSGPLTSDAGGDASNNTDAASGDAGDASVDAPNDASTVEITLGMCPALTPCGGDVVGTWNLTAGCLDDPLATAKGLCPTLVVNSETARASGSVSFTSNIVTRSYVTHYGMDITVPTACLQGASCAQAQTAYQMYIANTTCSAVMGGCECVGSVDTTASQGSAYSIMNDEIVTASGDHYAYCVNGTTMDYHHTAGPSPEMGTYTLTK